MAGYNHSRISKGAAIAQISQIKHGDLMSCFVQVIRRTQANDAAANNADAAHLNAFMVNILYRIVYLIKQLMADTGYWILDTGDAPELEGALAASRIQNPVSTSHHLKSMRVWIIVTIDGDRIMSINFCPTFHAWNDCRLTIY